MFDFVYKCCNLQENLIIDYPLRKKIKEMIKLFV